MNHTFSDLRTGFPCLFDVLNEIYLDNGGNRVYALEKLDYTLSLTNEELQKAEKFITSLSEENRFLLACDAEGLLDKLTEEENDTIDKDVEPVLNSFFEGKDSMFLAARAQLDADPKALRFKQEDARDRRSPVV